MEKAIQPEQASRGVTEPEVSIVRKNQYRLRQASEQAVDIRQGRELAEPPQSFKEQVESGAEGMESLGQVYRDPQTGKLIFIEGNG